MHMVRRIRGFDLRVCDDSLFQLFKDILSFNDKMSFYNSIVVN
jgi:hypothetical protein